VAKRVPYSSIPVNKYQGHLLYKSELDSIVASHQQAPACSFHCYSCLSYEHETLATPAAVRGNKHDPMKKYGLAYIVSCAASNTLEEGGGIQSAKQGRQTIGLMHAPFHSRVGPWFCGWPADAQLQLQPGLHPEPV